jgi:predicted RNA-binding protein YlxR (DUF448 family)
VACRTSRPKQELLRIVRSPLGVVTADPSGRANGRGAYVCRDTDCITNAINRGTLSRALEIPVPPELRDELLGSVPELTIQGGARGQE